MKQILAPALILPAIAIFALAGCGGPSDPVPTPAPEVTPVEPVAETTPAEADPAAERAAREAELANREADLALKEREQALTRREAELAAKQSAAKSPAPAKAAATPPRPVAVAATPPPPKAAPAPVLPIVVPAGTQMSIGISSAVSTKTASIGDPIDARLASDLVIDGRRAVLAGAPVRGRVTEVISGSRKIGGTPTLAMNFNGLELEDGTTVPISGTLVQQAKSDTAKDTAKIVGGTAAGAIIGHQIDDDKGKVIGGLLGGAAGAIAARNTGGEIDVPAGTVLGFVLDAPFQVRPN
ncbi:MAG TPA: glycine zipper 2TM domain-containing protein [Steroidobacteraceae bacterium]